jgi:hypothetical protein
MFMTGRKLLRGQTVRGSWRKAQHGIALITVLLLLTLLSGIAVALVYKVNHEQHLQGADSGNTVAYYGAEAGMEKMMADLSLLYAQKAAPTNCDITALQAAPPNAAAVGTTYREYVYNVPPPPGGGCAAPPTNVQTISSGANAGLQAQIVRMNLQVTADSPAGDEARLIRNVEVAEIPVFQFGVFSQSDLSYFPGPSFDFAGRVQTNGNLFLAEGGGATLTFHSPIRAAGDVVRDQLANGASTVAQGRTGQVLIPTAPNGCDAGQPACRNLQVTEGSSNGGPTPTYSPTGTGTVNGGWNNLSTNTYAYNILSGTTNAKALTLPFVQGTTGAIEIIRRPAPAESPTSQVGESRLYNQAQIRVLLSDDPSELPGGAGDAQNIRLANLQTSGGAPDYSNGVPVVGVGNTYFAEGVRTTDTTGGSTTIRVGPGGETNWNALPTTPPAGKATLVPATAPLLTPTITPVGPTTTTVQPWNLLDGYLRVEIRNGGGGYTPVTAEWLQLGFARGASALVNGAANPVHPNAILILQQQADRNGDGTASAAELVPDGGTGSVITGQATRNNWYPINLYEAREGEFRENQRTTTNCSIGGVLNLVEIDVHNLQRWLAGSIGASGPGTEYVSQNGYVLYLSDRRGTIVANSTLTYKNGEYGYEDVINPGSVTGAPDSLLNAGEDVNGNTSLDNAAKDFMGLGFGVAQPGTLPNATVSCMAIARPNWVSGPRHGVRLVNGSLGNLPVRPDNGQGGFTLASEQPAYVLGNYNANAGGFGDPHAAAAVMGDTVTLLSNNWTDLNSFKSPASVAGRAAVTSYYRLAIASGKNINFPQPAFAGVTQDFGTDGGVHNFLRYLENWGGQTLNYEGSMVSLFYSQYATGVFKCCGTVYSPPTRAYAFDTEFLDLSKLPPGTPKFRDVVNVGFQQVY